MWNNMYVYFHCEEECSEVEVKGLYNQMYSINE